jgi:hypothetical protein
MLDDAANCTTLAISHDRCSEHGGLSWKCDLLGSPHSRIAVGGFCSCYNRQSSPSRLDYIRTRRDSRCGRYLGFWPRRPLRFSWSIAFWIVARPRCGMANVRQPHGLQLEFPPPSTRVRALGRRLRRSTPRRWRTRGSWRDCTECLATPTCHNDLPSLRGFERGANELPSAWKLLTATPNDQMPSNSLGIDKRGKFPLHGEFPQGCSTHGYALNKALNTRAAGFSTPTFVPWA